MPRAAQFTVGHKTMKTHVTLCAYLASFTVATQCLWAEDDARQTQFPAALTDSTLREGVWIWGSGHHLPHMVIQEVVRIGKSGDKWNLEVFTLSHTVESFQRRQPPQIRREGPYPIQVTNGVLHIERPNGISKYSCRFHGDLFQFPAVVRTESSTFNFTFSESTGKRDGVPDGVNTWSYTWVCSSNPSATPAGTASLAVRDPEGEETTPCAYAVEESHDGPALIFRRKVGTRDGEDQIVWHRKFFGPQIYKSAAPRLDRPALQKTYRPADDSIRKQIAEVKEGEPNKPDARDGR